MPLIDVNARIFCRKPHSVTFQGAIEFGTGGTIYGQIQHPTEDYAFAIINSGISVFDISNRSVPSLVGVVTDAVGLIGNQTLEGLAFDSSGRYLYATSGATSLYTFDLGAAFATIEDPPVVGSPLTISQGNGLHVLTVTDGRLFCLADTVTNNSFQEIDISTPSAPSVASTTALTGHDLEALAGHPNASGEVILYPASDTSGKVIAVFIDAPGSFEVLQLPTIGGLQIRCTSGIAFSPDETAMVLTCFWVNGSINHYIWLVYDIGVGFSTAEANCTNEEIVDGEILSIRSPFICSSPKHAEFSGFYWNDGNDVLHLAVAIRDDAFGEFGELRFYAWSDLSSTPYFRVPRFSGATSVPGSYSLRAKNQGADKTEWLMIGVSADRSNAILSLLTSDLLQSVPSFLGDWFDLTADRFLNPEIILDKALGGGQRGGVQETGTLEFYLDDSAQNDTANQGGYSPDSASPVTEHFVDGSLIIMSLDIGAFSQIHFYGTVTKIVPAPGIHEEDKQKVKVTCSDGIETLVISDVGTLPLLSQVSTEDALLALWDRVPYLPGTERLVLTGESGTYIHDIAFDRDYGGKTKIVGVIRKLIDASGGFFATRLNVIAYVPLDTYKKASVFMVATAAPILTDQHIKGMAPERDMANLFNSVTVRYYPRKLETNDPPTTVIFRMEDRILIKPGQTVRFDASYRDPGGLASRIGAAEVVYPEVATDFTLRTKKSGGGQNINAQLSVSIEPGVTSTPIIAANAGPVAGWFLTQLRGNAIYSQEPQEVTERDPDSITKHQLRELVYDAQGVSDEGQARAIAKALLAGRKDPRTYQPTVSFSVDDRAVTQAAALIDLTGKVGVQEQQTGLVDEDYWRLGTGKLDDTSGADAANLYGLDIYSIQRVRFTIKSLGHLDCELMVIPEDLAVRTPGWIHPKNDWVDGEPPTENLFNLHLRDDVNAIWHEKHVQSADITKDAGDPGAEETTFEDLTGCEFDVLAGETWQFEAMLFIDSNATANAKATVVAVDVNGNDISSQVFGRIGLWGSGAPVSQGNTTTFGGTLNYAITGADEEAAVLSGRVNSPVDATIKVQGAQNTSSGTTVFRTLSPIVSFLVEAA